MASQIQQGLQAGLNNPNTGGFPFPQTTPVVPDSGAYIPPAPPLNAPVNTSANANSTFQNQLQQRAANLNRTNATSPPSGNAIVDATASLHKRVRDGTVAKWALMWLFITAIVSLIAVLQIHNAQATSTCWSTAVADAMAIACVVVFVIVCVMVGITYSYFTAQPRAFQAKRSFGYPPFVFFAFLTLIALTSWIMLVDVTAKGRSGVSNTGTSGTCTASSDYNAGIAGALMALVVSMIGTIGAYHWSK
jgi:hypothetical protein